MNPTNETHLDPEKVKEISTKAAETVQENAHSALIQSEHVIRKNPLPAVLISLVIGVLLGALAFRREEKKSNIGDDVRTWLESCPSQLKKFKKSLPDLPDTKCLQKQAQKVGKSIRFW